MQIKHLVEYLETLATNLIGNVPVDNVFNIRQTQYPWEKRRWWWW